MQIKLWPKNEKGLKEIAAKDPFLLNPTKLANFAIAIYLASKKGKKK